MSATTPRDICTCKHCGHFLGSKDQDLAESIGLDHDECVMQSWCLAESRSGEAALVSAAQDLGRFEIRLMDREADYLTRLYAETDANADSALSASDLFTTESLSARAVW